MIYRFQPILKTLVWGTENWVLSGVKGNETKVVGGPADGKTLNELYGGEFPLLIKFIDAKKDLSIQVHPNDEVAQQRHGCKGKTEMWYMIDTAPGAHLLAGLSKEISPEDYVKLVEEGRITEVLADHKVAPGDVFFLPAGRIHAICGGCYLAEIQETSDIPYRIFDYNRPGLDGKPRQLHTQEAKDAIDYTVHPDYRTHYEAEPDKSVELVKCRHFTTCLLDLTKPFVQELDACGDFLILICLEGEGSVNGTSFRHGEAILLPASDGRAEIIPDGCLKLLTTHV